MKYERLTERSGKAICIKETSTNDNKSIWNAIERLAELEDKLENGTLIELPCIHKTVFGYYRVTFFSKMFNCIDSELFFFKAEAEKKLKELQGESI
jgi:hypothetical protein